MESLGTIVKAIDYIEENLKNDISIGQVAAAIGYSEYHFLRIFKEFVGLTPASYIRKRRISEIVSLMETDDSPICDIAFEFGFNSKENFIRAFKAEHKILPTEYRRAKNSLLLYGRFEPFPTDSELLCDVIDLDPFAIIAFPSSEEFPPNFWNKYNAKGLSARLSGGRQVIDYGVCLWNEEKEKLDYWIGVSERDAKGNIVGTVRLNISGGLYAVFRTPAATHFDFVQTIRRTWDYIKNVWLPGSRFERRNDYELECYVEESRKFSETIYVPVKIKEK